MPRLSDLPGMKGPGVAPVRIKAVDDANPHQGGRGIREVDEKAEESAIAEWV
jgi:hypothetical protein